MKKLILIFAALFTLFVVIPSMAQKHKHSDDDAVVTIRVNGEDVDIEEYFEEMGEKIGESIDKAVNNDIDIDIDFDEGDFDIHIENFCDGIEAFAENLGEAIEHAVTHMNIELKNIDPDDIDDDEFNINGKSSSLKKELRKIEQKYNSEIETIERLNIKIREDYVRVDMRVKLENGKTVEKIIDLDD